MSKRKNRSTSPNLPQDALERARRQIAEERGETAPEPVVEDKPKPVAPAKPATPYRPITETRSTRMTPATVSAGRVSRRRANEPGQGKRRDEPEQYDMQAVRYQLQHPTKTVTVEELRQQYGYIVRDLRQIAVLAAGLILTLIVIALVLPK